MLTDRFLGSLVGLAACAVAYLAGRASRGSSLNPVETHAAALDFVRRSQGWFADVHGSRSHPRVRGTHAQFGEALAAIGRLLARPPEQVLPGIAERASELAGEDPRQEEWLPLERFELELTLEEDRLRRAAFPPGTFPDTYEWEEPPQRDWEPEEPAESAREREPREPRGRRERGPRERGGRRREHRRH